MLALAFVAAGILAIGRSVLQSTMLGAGSYQPDSLFSPAFPFSAPFFRNSVQVFRHPSHAKPFSRLLPARSPRSRSAAPDSDGLPGARARARPSR